MLFYALPSDTHKKLRYRRRRRAMLASSYYVSRGMGVRKVSNTKSDLQGHSWSLAMAPFDRLTRFIRSADFSVFIARVLTLAVYSSFNMAWYYVH